MTFEKGQSGNPAGRPKGSKNQATLAVQHLIEILEERMEEAKTLDFKEFVKVAASLLPKNIKIDADHTIVLNTKKTYKPEATEAPEVAADEP